MIKNFTTKDSITYLPVVTILVYICGYLIITGFLSNFNVINDEFVSINFIKSGILFSVILIPICIILYLNYKNPTDDFLKAKKYYPTLFINLFSYLFFISIFLIDFKLLTSWESRIFHIAFLLDIFLFFISTSYAFRNKSDLLKFFMSFTIPVIIISYLGLNYYYLGSLYLIIILICLTFITHLGNIHDGKYSIAHLSCLLIVFCYLTYLFGAKVYGHLPLFVGGAAPYNTTILSKPLKNEYLQKIGFSFTDNVYMANISLLFITSDKYLINNNGKIFYISKKLFNGFIINYNQLSQKINDKRKEEGRP